MSDINSRAVAQIDVNGNAGAELARLKKRAEDLKDAIAQAWKTGDTTAQKKLDKALKETKKQIRTIQNDMVNVEQTLKRLDKATPKELRQTLRLLEKDLKNIERGSKAWDEHTKKIKAVRSELAKIKAETKEQESLWNRFADKMFRWGTAIQTVMAGITGVTMTARQAVKAYAEVEQEMANVRKYTGMSAEQVETLNEEFKKMDTRSSREQLNQLAQEAGRLGMQSQEDVMGFVRAADKINVALDELGDGATLTLSKLTDIFGDRERLGVEKSLLAVGSVINELSQNCTASAPYIAEFASRLAGVGANAGMTTQQIMGYAAVMDSYGQKVESSATALSQIIVRLYREPAKYAEVAGLDVKNFTDLLKKDANAALIQLLETLNKVGGMDVLSPMFADMGENGARAIQALSTMAKHIDEVKAQQEVANQAFEEAISIDKEFNVQNNTVQAGLEKAKKNFNEVAVALGQKLAPLMKYTITSSSALMKVISKVVTFFIEYKSVIITITLAIAAYNVTIRASAAAHAVYNTIVKAGTILQQTWRALVMASAYAFNYIKGNTERAAAAQRVLNNTMKANPLGLVISAVVALGAALIALNNKIRQSEAETKRLKKEQKEWLDSIEKIDEAENRYCSNELTRLKALYEAATNETASRKERIKAAKDMQTLYPQIFSNFSAEEIMANEAAMAYNKLTQSIIANARARAAAEKIMENEKLLLDLEDKLAAEEERKKEAQNRLNRDRQQQAYQASANSGQHAFTPTGVQTHAEEQTSKSIRENTSELEDANKNLTQIRGQMSDLNKAQTRLMNIPGVKEIVQGNNQPTSSPNVSYTRQESEKERKKRLTEEKAAQREREKQARIAAALEKKEFKDAMDVAKAHWNTQQTEALKQYRSGQLDYEAYLENLHDAAQEYYEKALEIHKQHGTEESDAAAKLYKAQEKEKQDHEKNMLQLRLERYADERDATKVAIQMDYYDASNEAFHNQRMLDEKLAQNEIEYLRKVLSERTAGTKEYYDAERALDIAIKQEEMRRRKQLEQDLMTWSLAYQKLSLQKQMEAELAVVDEVAKHEKWTAEETEKAKAEIRKKYRDKERSEIDSATGTTAPGSAMDDLASNRDKALAALEKERAGMTDEEYQSRRHQIIKKYHDSVTELIRSEGSEWATMITNVYEKWASALESLGGTWEEKLKSITDLAEASFAVMNVGLQMYMEQAAAARDLEVAKAEKSYERQISMAEGNAYKTKQLEKKKQKEVARIKNEYNKRAQTIEVAQAIASTAIAAINAYASAAKVPLVGHILGPIAAAMATAAGLAQVATIKKQHAAEAAGYSKGGFTPEGRVDEPVGVVHAGEWVASKKLVDNPATRPAIEALEFAQRNNRIGELSSAAVTRTVTAPAVIAQAAADGSMEQAILAMSAVIDRYRETMTRLDDRLDLPFVTVNTVSGDLGIKQAQDEYQRLENNTLPKSKRK